MSTRTGPGPGSLPVTALLVPYVALADPGHIVAEHTPLWATWWAAAGYLLVAIGFAAVVARVQGRRAERVARLEHAERLAIIEARLREAQRIASLGNWVWDSVTREFWWSDECYRIFQLSRAEARDGYDAFLERVHPDDREMVRGAVRDALRERRPLSVDYRIIRRDGAERVIHQRAVVEYGDDGRPSRMAGTIHDITDLKEAEAEIRRRADFAALLAGLSSDLVRAPPGEIDAPLADGLAVIGRHYGLDVIGVWWLEDGGRSMRIRKRWERKPGRPPRDVVSESDLPWISRQLRTADVIVADDLGSLPAAAAADVALLEDRGAKSLVVIPLLIDGRLRGACHYISIVRHRHWTGDTVSEFRLLAEHLANALARADAVVEISRLKEQLQEENLFLKHKVQLASRHEGIIGEDPGLRACLQAVEKVAPTNVPVLVLGETGTGKELIARAVHELSARSAKPLVSVNCPALPSDIIESELFGHEAGAFTGAHSRRRGRFELAHEGTLFLDEIGELPLEVQSKLLRALQTGEFERLGGTETLTTDVRLVAATNRDLRDEVARGTFRADLYYRISSFPVRLPPLRERKTDIPLLAEHFVHKHAGRFGKNVKAISARMLRQLMQYDWPGNIRELESTIQRALIASSGSDVLQLAETLRPGSGLAVPGPANESDARPDLMSFERRHIVRVLEQTDWKIAGAGGAAAALGIPASTLRSKMKRLGIAREPV
ncbi:MAG: sigma 54-interacting transcriptional regulator [Woeseiaceae bacterium]|nr:sigma 54-interacting transcriptional regulator [Woeseiaceae bacterium]